MAINYGESENPDMIDYDGGCCKIQDMLYVAYRIIAIIAN